MNRVIGLAVATAMITNAACASSPKEAHLDRLWKQGDGFNNPYPERIRNGQKPPNFGERG